MKEYVGVRFKKVGKINYFRFNGHKLNRGDIVIAETAKGQEYGKVEIACQPLDEAPQYKIIRKATEKDHQQHVKNKMKELDAAEIFLEKIKKHELDMKLVETELVFDCSKMIFYFASEQRVDFRKLVKELASIFHTRIELRQIGVRDEAKSISSVGMCGRDLCCSTFLGDFQPVSIKMAKEQGLSLNPTKISGVCGRLMCCLKFEEETYAKLNANLPKEGDLVKTPDGRGNVLSVNILQQIVKVSLLKKDDGLHIAYYDNSEISVVKK
ncbi:MAG: stage 0 sporulation family protein [Defluviitaleaceae bacterium]|nr:stage 0 sporulation family protein [Defluviitaleaceae bacterium]